MDDSEARAAAAAVEDVESEADDDDDVPPVNNAADDDDEEEEESDDDDVDGGENEEGGGEKRKREEAPGGGTEDEEDEDESDDDDDEGFAALINSRGGAKKKPLKKKRPAAPPKAKKPVEPKVVAQRRPPPVAKPARPPQAADPSRYFDDMADEEDDEDEGDDEKTRKLKQKQAVEDKELQDEMRRQDTRRQREARFEGEDADVSKTVGALEERYQRSQQNRMQSTASSTMGDNEDVLGTAQRGSMLHDAARQANAPALSDPRMWAVPCKIGSEKEAALSLMNKAIAKARAGEPLGISAVLCTGLRGFIYLESRTEPAAKKAVEGMRLLRGWSMKMVPVCDMVSVVSTQAKKKKAAGRGDGVLRVGDWARVNRDKYRGDLARIVAVGDGGATVVVQLLPRVDPGAAPGTKMRPPQRLFSTAEMLAAGADVSRRRFRGMASQPRGADSGGGAFRTWAFGTSVFDFYENNFYRRGFLYREINAATMLKKERTVPTLDELQRFVTTEGGDEDEEEEDDGEYDEEAVLKRREASAKEQGSLLEQIESLAMGSSTDAAPGTKTKALYSRGDRVACIEGEMKNFGFVVKYVEDQKSEEETMVVHCEPYGEAAQLFPGAVQIEASRLVKVIAVGSRVAVSDGTYAGQTGIVLEQGLLKDELVAVVLVDNVAREISVPLAHVHETTAVARGLDSLEGYELHDVVQLPAGCVGVVSNVANEDLEVITNRGELRRVRPAEISRKLNAESRRSISLDSREEHVREGDAVIVEGGDSKGAEATVIKAYRAVLWLQPTNTAGGFGMASGGLFFAKARQVRVAGNRAAAAGLANSYMGLGRERTVTEDQFNNSGAGVEQRGGLLRRPARDPMLARTVRVCKGNFKGLAGIVTTATATHVTVELHTRRSKITLPRERVKVVDGEAGGEEVKVIERSFGAGASSAYEGDMSTPFLQQQTPLPNQGQTPQYGSQTPMVGGRTGQYTPGRPGAETPAHGGQTPAYYAPGTPGRGALTPGRQTPVADRGNDVWAPSAFDKEDPESHQDQQKKESESYLGVERRAATPIRAEEIAEPQPVLASAGAWCVSGACALLGPAPGEECRVDTLDLRNDSAQVTIRSTRLPKVVRCRELRRLDPKPKDRVRLVDNDETYDAELLSIEDNDGIIKLDNGEYNIIDFSAIAKLALDGDYAADEGAAPPPDDQTSAE